MNGKQVTEFVETAYTSGPVAMKKIVLPISEFYQLWTPLSKVCFNKSIYYIDDTGHVTQEEAENAAFTLFVAVINEFCSIALYNPIGQDACLFAIFFKSVENEVLMVVKEGYGDD